MKYIITIIILSLFFSKNLYSEVKISNFNDYTKTNKSFNLAEVYKGLNHPWGMTFIDEKNLLITEKKGTLLKFNIESKKISKIKHNLKIKWANQGGLLDVLYHDGYIYFSYSHDHGFNNGYSNTSTAIARGKIVNDNINDIEILLIGDPGDPENRHYGSRIIIKDNYLFASFGDKGRGKNSQNPKTHNGSIIRINLDGSIPKDNPKFIDKPNWLPEIYQIGLRNPQGMTLSPFDNNIYISNHGAKGGDFVGKIFKSGNYGWNLVGWGGVNYNGSKIGDGIPFKDGFDNPLISWVPSIAPSNIQFYDGKMFPDWKGDLLVTSLKFNMLIKLKIQVDKITKVISEEIILRGCKTFENGCYKIGRIRDIEIDKDGSIYIITDEMNSPIWKLYN